MAEPAVDTDLFDTEDTAAKTLAVARADAQPDADDIPLSDVKRWLQSWGKDDELPPPPWK